MSTLFENDYRFQMYIRKMIITCINDADSRSSLQALAVASSRQTRAVAAASSCCVSRKNDYISSMASLTQGIGVCCEALEPPSQ